MIQYKYKNIYILLFTISLLFTYTACELEEIDNPNGADLESIESAATLTDLQALVAGTESLMRFDIGFYYEAIGVVGREWYRFTGSDPRYTADLLGKENAILDNNTFYTTRTFTGRYKCIKTTNILINALPNVTGLSDAQSNGFLGFAKTIQAYQLLVVLNMQFQNGVRVDVANPDALGPFLSYDESLAAIASMLDDGFANLNAGEFAFSLSSGFSSFNTAATFAQFNRAIAARVALYQGNHADALAKLNDSFLDLNGDLSVGARHVFSTAGGDIPNPMSYQPVGSDALAAHPTFVTDAEEGDTRLSKVALRTSIVDGEPVVIPASLDGLSSDYDVALYFSQNSTINITKNGELALIYAEAQANQGSSDEAIAAINAVRAVNGLGEYAGGTSTEELMNEIVHQRRYELFGEGHRWVDMRRLGRLGELPIDREGDDVWDEFPRPATEN